MPPPIFNEKKETVKEKGGKSKDPMIAISAMMQYLTKNGHQSYILISHIWLRIISQYPNLREAISQGKGPISQYPNYLAYTPLRLVDLFKILRQMSWIDHFDHDLTGFLVKFCKF